MRGARIGGGDVATACMGFEQRGDTRPPPPPDEPAPTDERPPNLAPIPNGPPFGGPLLPNGPPFGRLAARISVTSSRRSRIGGNLDRRSGCPRDRGLRWSPVIENLSTEVDGAAVFRDVDEVVEQDRLEVNL